MYESHESAKKASNKKEKCRTKDVTSPGAWEKEEKLKGIILKKIKEKMFKYYYEKKKKI